MIRLMLSMLFLSYTLSAIAQVPRGRDGAEGVGDYAEEFYEAEDQAQNSYPEIVSAQFLTTGGQRINVQGNLIETDRAIIFVPNQEINEDVIAIIIDKKTYKTVPDQVCAPTRPASRCDIPVNYASQSGMNPENFPQGYYRFSPRGHFDK